MEERFKTFFTHIYNKADKEIAKIQPSLFKEFRSLKQHEDKIDEYIQHAIKGNMDLVQR